MQNTISCLANTELKISLICKKSSLKNLDAKKYFNIKHCHVSMKLYAYQ